MSQSTIRRAILIGVPILVVLGVGAWLIPKLMTPPAADCPITPATEQDFKEAQRPGVRVFEVDGWRVESGEQQALVSVLWTPPEGEALAHSQLLLYNCGYTDTDLERFYGVDGF